MTKRKSAVDFPFSTPFLDGEVQPGQVYDLPDTQPDGSPIIWPADYWTDVDKPKASSSSTPSSTPSSEKE